ncbi:MAG: VanZ family protein [Pirellula sp.]
MKRTNPLTRHSVRLTVFFAIWLALIFGTSCTVVRPLEFFRLVQEYSGADQAWMEQFEAFWGVSWFAIIKGWHFTEFAILLILCVCAIRWWVGSTTAWSIFGAMLFCIAFAACDEWHQSLVPDRFGTIQDVLIDSLGVCAAGSYLLFRHKKQASMVS